MLQGKVVWITGASSGIGEALLYECIRRGAKVVASSNDSGELNRVIASTGADKERVIAAPFDLAETRLSGVWWPGCMSRQAFCTTLLTSEA
jgi:NAD(P)-dependent dehydrogenase (short-subunit alcohol dehydrogenase family)